MKILLQVVSIISISFVCTVTASEEEVQFNKCTWERDYAVRAECFKKPYETQKNLLEIMLSDIESSLKDKAMVEKIKHEQQEWEVQIEQDCKIDVLKNIRWVEKKVYVDAIEKSVCLYNKTKERIGVVRKYLPVKETNTASSAPDQTSAPNIATCKYFDNFDTKSYGWLYPMVPETCLCDEQAENMKSYVPDGLKVTAACDLKHIEHGYFDGTIYLTGKYYTDGYLERYDSASGSGLFFTTYQDKFEHREDYTLQERDFVTFDFADEDRAIGKLNIPPLDGNNRCWTAKAKLRIKDLAVHSEETDAGGSWILDFDALKVGDFSSCVPGG